MAYPWSRTKTWITGEILTASDLNTEFQTDITNAIPANIDDYSATVTVMRDTVDPYPASSESLATTLSGELARIRYLIAQITGETQWYIDPDGTLAGVFTNTTTFAGAKTFSSAVTINPTTNQLVLGVTNTTTISATAPSASRVLTIPDPGGAASFVMTEGTQTINGAKTFGSAIITSAVNNTGGVDIQGSNTNDAAAAGYMGESTVSSVATVSAPTSTQYGDLTSISLTAGDWDVGVTGSWNSSGGTWTVASIGVSSISGNDNTGLVNGQTEARGQWASSSTTPLIITFAIPPVRFSLASTTTIYLKFRSDYSAGTPQANGRIFARRVR